jgi:hypothetical protein
MKIAVYTFISGVYDSLKPYNKEFAKEADFYFFTDNPQKPPTGSGEYKTIIVPIQEGTERYVSRHYKILSHELFPGYDYIIWLDGSTSIEVSPKELVNKYLSSCDLAAFKYPDDISQYPTDTKHKDIDDCIYSHAAKCVKAGRLSKLIVGQQMTYYQSQGFSQHAGFCELRVILRRNIELVKAFNNLVLDIYKRWLTCDQLCFNYCTWKLGIKYNTIEWGSPEFKTGGHNILYNPHKYYWHDSNNNDVLEQAETT